MTSDTNLTGAPPVPPDLGPPVPESTSDSSGGKAGDIKDSAKQQAAQVAQPAAGNRVVANEISVEPVDQGSAARSIEHNTDDAIEKNYKAALIAKGLDKQNIHYNAKNGVLTLKGSVKTTLQRSDAQQIAANIPQPVSAVTVSLSGRGE